MFFRNLQKHVCSLMHNRLANQSYFRFAFNVKKVVQDQAKFELKIGESQHGQAMQAKIYDLTEKLESESPFNEGEKAMMLMMSMADLSLRYKNFDLAGQIFDNLSLHLDEYQDNNMAFYQYLAPAVVFRQALISEQLQKDSETIDNQLLKVTNMIEDYHSHSATLIEENVRLLAKTYEKLGGRAKKQQKLQKSLEYYQKSLGICSEIFPKNSVFVVKMNCMVGELLSREQDQQKTAITYLQAVFDNIVLKTPEDGQMLSLAANAVLKIMLNNPNTYTPQEIATKITEIEDIITKQDPQKRLIPPLSRSVILTMKAENQLNLGEKEKAKKTFDDSLALALEVFPPTHNFVQSIFKKMSQL